MVESLQVQHAVHDEVGDVVGEFLALLARLAAQHRRAQHEVAGERKSVIVHEGQHVGRMVPAAELGVQALPLPRADEADGDGGGAVERGARPAAQGSARRQRAGRDRVLDDEGEADAARLGGGRAAALCRADLPVHDRCARASASSLRKSGTRRASSWRIRFSPT